MNIDYEALRKDLEHFVLTSHFEKNAKAKTAYLNRIILATELELIEIANECNFPLSDYEIDNYKRKK